MTTNTIITPDVPRVRDLLDQGTLVDYLTETGTLNNLAEEIITNPLVGTPITARTDEEVHRGYERIRDLCAQEGRDISTNSESLRMYRFELTLENLLRQIIAEGLAEEVAAALPADVVRYSVDQAESTNGREWLVSVEQRDTYQCSVTGEQRSGTVVVIVPRWETDVEIAQDSGAVCPILISPEIIKALEV